jgi:hypothetical protein
VLAALRQVRPIDKPVSVASRGEAARVVQKVSRWLPDDWTARSDAAGDLEAVRIRGRRSSYRMRQGGSVARISLSPAATEATVLHEFAHRVQDVLPGLDALFQELHRRRTVNDPLELITRFAPGELGRPDGYVHRYQGREYSFRNANGGALEVITMAFQYALSGEPVDFDELRRQDPEMLHLVLGTLWYYR